MNELFSNCESYILNEDNMQNYLKYKLIETNNSKNSNSTNNINYNKNIINIKSNSSNVFIPREQDSLFWCYYIIKNGDVQYEMLQNRNTLTTKNLKINLVSKIRENKPIVKINKIDTISNIESNLANDNLLSIKSFMNLCAIDNINVVFVSNKMYYELLTNDTDSIYIIREIANQLKYNKQYGYEIASEELLQDIRSNLYKVDSLDKPIKAISSYKVSELLEIANKLAIEVVHKDTGKTKTKNELYESIIQHF
jgi:hypothetical protein